MDATPLIKLIFTVALAIAAYFYGSARFFDLRVKAQKDELLRRQREQEADSVLRRQSPPVQDAAPMRPIPPA